MKDVEVKTNGQRSVLQETLDEADPVRDTAWSDELRKPFPKELVCLLPKVTCRECTNKSCKQHRKQKCSQCDAYVSESHIHLPYVGHADVTLRLLDVDPAWDWEPMAVDARGLPLFERAAAGNPIGLWIYLTVHGVRRRGFGSVEGNAFDPEKQLIGDAIRNAALRFGVATTLWSKGEHLNAQIEEPPSDGGAGAKPPPSKRAEKPARDFTPDEKASHAAAFDKKSAGAPPERLGHRTVQGVTITIPYGWDHVKHEHIQPAAASKFGGKAVWAKQVWGWAIEGEPDGAREVWLAALVGRARGLHAERTAINVAVQCAVLAYDALQAKRSPPPGDSLCPTSEMEEKSFEGMKEGGAADEDPG